MKPAAGMAAAALLLGSCIAQAQLPGAAPGDAKVVFAPRIASTPDGGRELVLDASIAEGWVLYASDFEQPDVGPQVARLTAKDGTATDGALASVAAKEGHGSNFAGDYRYTYFTDKGQFRQRLASRDGPVNAEIRAQACFEESGLCELVRQRIAVR
ncbi:protein-disulfide reductase DsbD domain-containing protein [Pseudoxanthomonas sp.]|uniref:protein-disulfide reductase DsbD domain-containing protein n=1 Tax=Pseudoxanthomonas sp. TaxID=1871049 RepID=UPI00261138D2|nr:protein-disulfide reductase DsbD domain-containing protein [Pseudoxanthomonas sp.]WDS37005.1 MAG: protein-disulfide reductase DsbD family protein [Pseudoxanthomonas sp.]